MVLADGSDIDPETLKNAPSPEAIAKRIKDLEAHVTGSEPEKKAAETAQVGGTLLLYGMSTPGRPKITPDYEGDLAGIEVDPHTDDKQKRAKVKHYLEGFVRQASIMPKGTYADAWYYDRKRQEPYTREIGTLLLKCDLQLDVLTSLVRKLTEYTLKKGSRKAVMQEYPDVVQEVNSALKQAIEDYNALGNLYVEAHGIIKQTKQSIFRTTPMIGADHVRQSRK